MSDLSPKERDKLLLAEYRALRSEIIKRMETQTQVILVTITSWGVVITIAFQSGNRYLSLLYPVLAIFLATAWAHDDYRVRQTGAYILERIERRLGQDTEQRYWISWEHYLASTRRRRRGDGLHRLASRGIFVASELLAILLGVSPLFVDRSSDLLAFLNQITWLRNVPSLYVALFVTVLALILAIAPTLGILAYGAHKSIPAIPSVDTNS